MPYKLILRKDSGSTHWYVRGTEFGIECRRCTKTADRREAQQILKAWRDEAKRLSVSGPKREVQGFASAARDYVLSGRSELFLTPLVKHFGETPLDEIDQQALDRAAAILGSRRQPQTNNRLVYTPVIAIIRHAGHSGRIKRPKMAMAGVRIGWLKPEEAFRLLSAAREIDGRLGALLTFLLYTGVRLSEALRLEWKDIDLNAATATIGRTKNGSAITVYLVPHVISTLANLEGRQRVFGISKCGRLYALLDQALRRAGVSLPPRTAFHVLRHSHVTWRRLYAGQDTRALLDVGLHKSPRMVERYTHLDVTEEARKADLLPVPKRMR